MTATLALPVERHRGVRTLAAALGALTGLAVLAAAVASVRLGWSWTDVLDAFVLSNAVMGLAFGAEAALRFTQPGVAGWQWWLTATISIVASAAFSVLELFVAFLQAYIITFLSALFIGAAIHKH